MRRGDIYLADLNPVRGSEAARARPVVIVSSDALNEVVDELRRGVVTTVPLTSNVATIYSFQVLLPAEVTGLDHDSKAQAEQIRVLAVERFAPTPVGAVPDRYMLRIDDALRLHLALD